MSTVDLDAIRARTEAATQGPWEAIDGLWSTDNTLRCVSRPSQLDDHGFLVMAAYTLTEADAEWIAHARTDVPALLAEVDRLNAERDRLNTVIGQVRELAEKWRYKGEFGWGPSHGHEGDGPDPDSYILDQASIELRAALGGVS